MAEIIKTTTKIKLWSGIKRTRNRYDNGRVDKIDEPATEQEILAELEKVGFDERTTNQIKSKNNIPIA